MCNDDWKYDDGHAEPQGEPSDAQIGRRGLVTRADGKLARVTHLKGVWGYWTGGRRIEPFDSREQAASAFLSEVTPEFNLDAAIRAYQDRDPNEFTAEWMPRVLRAASITERGDKS